MAAFLPSDELHARIARRARQMFAHGLVEEVRRLRQTHPRPFPHRPPRHGYEEAAAVLDGRLTEETAIRQVTTRTRQYAKRQMTWFRNRRRPLGRSHPPRRHRTPRQQSPPIWPASAPPACAPERGFLFYPPPPAVVYRDPIKGCQHE